MPSSNFSSPLNVEIPRKETKVSFITDRDSISFDVKYGVEYKFIILLNGRDSCHTTIVAKYKTPVVYQRNNSLARIDSIPFRIGNNSKIYLKAGTNGSDSLYVQFDLGNSGAPIIKKSILLIVILTVIYIVYRRRKRNKADL